MSAYRKTSRPEALSSSSTIRTTRMRDLTWGRPVFKAPHLPSPRTIFDPQPFTNLRPSRDRRDGEDL